MRSEEALAGKPAKKFTGDPYRVETKIHFQRRVALPWMISALLFADLLSLLTAGTIAIVIRRFLVHQWHFDLYGQILLIALLCQVFYALRGLYPGIGIGPVNELKQLTLMTTAVVLGMAASTFWLRNNSDFSRMTLGISWIFSLFTVPLGRTIIRTTCAKLGIWGQPVAVIGNGPQGYKLVTTLLKHPNIGLYPTVILFSRFQEGSPGQNISVLPAEEMLNQGNLAKLFGIRTAIIVMEEIPKELATEILRTHHAGFRSFIVVQNNGGINHLGITPFYIDSILGLRVNDNLSSWFAQFQSRLIDLFGSLFGLALLSPLFLIVSVLIRIDSPGKAIYRQKRIGKGGKQFDMLKFRTMYLDADVKLTNYLTNDDSLKQEWEQFQKLRDDPRITRLGRFLRRYSIDELPQLWNVLKGEMSLVGPRPFLPEQLEIYNHYADYVRVLPGITGLWQVLGRNETDFNGRAQFDEYYVHNWSIWLDIHILARTFWVVLTKTGAF